MIEIEVTFLSMIVYNFFDTFLREFFKNTWQSVTSKSRYVLQWTGYDVALLLVVLVFNES